jgi:hypothetical protein
MTTTEHAYRADCCCDDCERIGNDLAREARAEARAEREQRLAHRSAHPLVDVTR